MGSFTERNSVTVAVDSMCDPGPVTNVRETGGSGPLPRPVRSPASGP